MKDPENNSGEGKHYLQVRYVAEIDKVNEFRKEFESSDRMFVSINKLTEFIVWLALPSGAGQIKALKK